ncbi:hypothetical protein H8B13_19000 [Hymenobacter sp. BT188]|uniref:hypothetical protein n=1 Tax=Hymenobacter sp. BT188 TaxID=2763504 RepID=UPI00165151B3|nr:hypothetical protein [Hymenobacter sp. BT188]MBC6608917.1 hypothetical protein [Hymenobacter sp. BT188]
MIPKIPRWQQVLLLAGALLAVATSLVLRLTGHTLFDSFTPLSLPLLLWRPFPVDPFKRLYWWLMVFLLFGLVAVMLAVTLQQSALLNL